uniref:Terpene synthase N-terminal domain-containing protein n=2 Tax=Brassica campestris TaxID=3711 RepID=M4FDR7_BRACM
MSTLCIGSTHIYHNALRLSPTSRSPRRLAWTSVTTKTVTAIVDTLRGSANYQPSRWDHEFLLSLENIYVKRANSVRDRDFLKEKVRKVLDETATPLEQLELVDKLQRLGVSYHFESKIDNILTDFYRNNVRECGKEDLHATALKFRLLREHSFNVTEGLFDVFISKIEDGTFESGDIRDSSDHNIYDVNVLELAVEALEMPYHWRMKRLETRRYIDAYSKHDVLIEFAKIDFNIVQAVHQEELKYLSSQVLETLSRYQQHVVRCSAIVLRLANDLGTSPDELKRGDVLKSVQCYMNETGASEEKSRAYVEDMISNTWNEMNNEIISHDSSLLPRGFVEAAINLARIVAMATINSSESAKASIFFGLLMDETTEQQRPSASFSYSNWVTNVKKSTKEAYEAKPHSHWILLTLSCTSMLTAFPASSLLSRLYFSNGGQSKWIISWVAVAGWPITCLILLPLYIFRKIKPTPLNAKLVLSYTLLGFLSAADNLMYAYAYAYLPASTSSLLASSSLAFSALFGYLIVKNPMNASVINSIVIITGAMAIIALDSSSDRYDYVTNRQYFAGFFWDIMGSTLHGLIFALSELVFVKLLGRRFFHVALEQQVMVSLVAFAFTTLGMVVSRDLQGMSHEAKSFEGGESRYVQVLVWSAVTFQLGVLGATAVLFLASTVMAGVLNAVRVPITSVAAVILMHDPMSGFKILSLVLTFWGFSSYIYGSSSRTPSTQAASSSS